MCDFGKFIPLVVTSPLNRGTRPASVRADAIAASGDDDETHWRIPDVPVLRLGGVGGSRRHGSAPPRQYSAPDRSTSATPPWANSGRPETPPPSTPPARSSSLLRLRGLRRGLHRHGFESPQSFMLPLMRLARAATNPNPEPLTYEKFRAILVAFRDRLEKAVGDAGHGAGRRRYRHRSRPRPSSASISTRTAPSRRTKAAAAIMAALSRGGIQRSTAGAARLAFRFDRADGYLAAGLCRIPHGAGRFLAGA